MVKRAKTTKKVGKLGKLIKNQADKKYFSKLPDGTLFIALREINLPSYDLVGYFLNVSPQKLKDGVLYYMGYLKRGSYEIIGEIYDHTDLITKGGEIDFDFPEDQIKKFIN